MKLLTMKLPAKSDIEANQTAQHPKDIKASATPRGVFKLRTGIKAGRAFIAAWD